MFTSRIRTGFELPLRSISPLLCSIAAAVALLGCGSQAASSASPARPATAMPPEPAAPAVAATPDAAAAAQAQEGTISIKDFMFSPTSITVSAGSTVHWKNLDGEPHTVSGIEAPFRSGALDQNDTFTFTFSKPGTYRYACSIHPQMVGTITVK